MKVEPAAIPDVKLVIPTIHGDPRGFFSETWSDPALAIRWPADADPALLSTNDQRLLTLAEARDLFP